MSTDVQGSAALGHYGSTMRTVGLMLLLMLVATVYVYDVAGARRPMTDAYTVVLSETQDIVRGLRDRVPDVR